MKRVFIIHGWQSEPMDGWKPWLGNELTARGYAVRTPHMPNSRHPKCDRWIAELAKIVGKPDRNTHFVGHSLGCPAILRYLETLSPGQLAGNVVLVAGFMEDLGIPDVAGFVDAPFDTKRIRTSAARIVSIHSDNDQYIPHDHFARMKKALGAIDVVVPGGRHFSGSDGCYQLPQAIQALQ